MKRNAFFILASLASVLLFFQNCSDGVSFSPKVVESSSSEQNMDIKTPQEDNVVVDPIDPDSEPDIVCNPLNTEQTCEGVSPQMGLLGQLYYMTPSQHEAVFNNDLRNALIDDYRDFGILIPADILMTTINVTPRSWGSGFFLSSGEQVKKEDGEDLLEWFHLDLAGFIELPAGSYQFATLSDDGMRITLNDEVIINDDGVHAPRHRCAQAASIFNSGEKKRIRVQYFQGPRTQISMVLLARPLAEENEILDDQECSNFQAELEFLPEGVLTRF